MCQIRVNLRRWACLLAALACLLALLPLPAHAAGAASKVVRVGWYEDAYNITGKNGERSGYTPAGPMNMSRPAGRTCSR